jgi:MYXO-CTERM domain-containing protein
VLSIKRIMVVVVLLAVGGIAVPSSAQTPGDQTMPTTDADDGFDDWGLLGLLGLAGLLGRKRRDVVDTRRV